MYKDFITTTSQIYKHLRNAVYNALAWLMK